MNACWHPCSADAHDLCGDDARASARARDTPAAHTHTQPHTLGSVPHSHACTNTHMCIKHGSNTWRWQASWTLGGPWEALDTTGTALVCGVSSGRVLSMHAKPYSVCLFVVCMCLPGTDCRARSWWFFEIRRYPPSSATLRARTTLAAPFPPLQTPTRVCFGRGRSSWHTLA